MINVMHLLTSFHVGGAESVALNLARATDRARFRTMACSLSGDGPMRPLFEEQGIETRCITAPANPFTRHVALAKRLARQLRADDVRVLHCHADLPAIYGPVAARMTGVRAVVFTQHSYLARSARDLGLFLQRTVSPLISHYVAISRGVLDNATQAGLMKQDRATVIYNGVDLNRFKSDLATRENGGPVEIVCVARLSPEKRHADLLDAMRMLVDRKLPVRLTLIGDGALRSDLEARTRSLGIAGHVRFLGTRADVADLLPGFDIFVLSSDFEGLPLSILEAMACRLPVVATDVGSVCEAVEDGRTGLLAPALAPEKLADALERLARDAPLRAAMGAAGRTRAERVFALDVVVREHENLYETLVREGDARK